VAVQKAAARSQNDPPFRRDHLKPLREVCRAFTLLCKQLDLFGGALVAIDGSMLGAVSAKGRHFTKAKLE
jgi:transposase